LIEFIKDMQAIITCTNVEHLEKLMLEGSRTYKVESGMIVKD